MMANMNILVTGATGFIGQAVVAELCNSGHHVRAMVRHSQQVGLFRDNKQVTTVVADVTEPSTLLEAMRDIGLVIHLAGVVWGETSQMHDIMVDGTRNLLEAMQRASVPRLLLVSSLLVYDWSKVEGTLTESSPIASESAGQQGAYSLAKTQQELLARSLRQRYGIRLTVLRPGGVVAPNKFDAADIGPRLGALQFVISPRRLLRIINVRSVAEAIAVACSASFADGVTVNLVDHESITAWEFAQRMKKVGTGLRFLLPLPYSFLMGIAHVVYPFAKLCGLEKFVPGLLHPSRIVCRFKNIRCDMSAAREYLPLKSSHSIAELFPSRPSMPRAKQSQ